MLEWGKLPKENKDEIIREYMRQDKEMDFREYARKKRDIFFTEDDIELYLYDFDEKRVVEKEQQEEWYKFVWEDLPKEQQLRLIQMYIKQDKTNTFAVYLIKNKIKCNIRELYDYWYDGKQIREWQEEKYAKKEEQEIRLTKTGYEKNKEEYKYGEFKHAIEEKPKTAAKRVKLSEMSDEELKEYYKNQNAEKERRKRIREEIEEEERLKDEEMFKRRLEQMTSQEIKEKYYKTVGTTIRFGGNDTRIRDFAYTNGKDRRENRNKTEIIKNVYNSKPEIIEMNKIREKEEYEYHRYDNIYNFISGIGLLLCIIGFIQPSILFIIGIIVIIIGMCHL